MKAIAIKYDKTYYKNHIFSFSIIMHIDDWYAQYSKTSRITNFARRDKTKTGSRNSRVLD